MKHLDNQLLRLSATLQLQAGLREDAKTVSHQMEQLFLHHRELVNELFGHKWTDVQKELFFGLHGDDVDRLRDNVRLAKKMIAQLEAEVTKRNKRLRTQTALVSTLLSTAFAALFIFLWRKYVPRLKIHLQFLEDRLKRSGWIAGEPLTPKQKQILNQELAKMKMSKQELKLVTRAAKQARRQG